MSNATTEFIKSNIGAIAAGVGGVALGATLAAVAIKRSNKKKRKSTYKTSRSRNSKRGGRYTPHTAGKGKDTSHRRIRYTKKGQPYIIMGSGKAKFIKKSSARRSHKQKGGRY